MVHDTTCHGMNSFLAAYRERTGDTNEWAKQGWEVFSVVCPQPSNYSTYRLTAKRATPTKSAEVERKFR